VSAAAAADGGQKRGDIVAAPALAGVSPLPASVSRTNTDGAA